jgi:class I fructose-bisphosphate aldolase
VLNPETDKLCPKPYNDLDITEVEAFRHVVKSAGRALVLVSGGSKISDEDLLNKVRMSFEAGATGLIFGRNMWQRPLDEALALTNQVKQIIAELD